MRDEEMFEDKNYNMQDKILQKSKKDGMMESLSYL